MRKPVWQALVLLLSLPGRSATGQEFLWATSAGGLQIDRAAGIAVDEVGNSYVTGRFEGVATFGAAEPNETVLTSAGSWDVFVAKYNDMGRLVWATGAGGTEFDRGRSIAIDDAGNSYVTGWFEETAVFGAGEPNETVLTSAGSREIFVAKYDGSGQLVWADREGGAISDTGVGIAVDAGGNPYVTGLFGNVAVFGAGEPNETVLTSAGGFDVFVVRYDTSGQLVWATGAGGAGSDVGESITVDATGNPYVTGTFQATAVFGAGEPNETVLTSAGDDDVFVARYDAQGSLLGATGAGGIDADGGTGIAVDASGHTYVTGFFQATAAFGVGEPNETVLTSAGGRDVLVAEYDESGLLSWAIGVGATADDRGLGIAVDGTGGTYVAGSFHSSITFGPGEPNETVLQSAGSLDVFVARHDGSGLLQEATRAGGFRTDEALAIAVDGAGRSHVAGRFGTTATFGAGELNETVLASAGRGDVFVARFAATLFSDGFEVGDTSRWSATVP